MKAIIITNKFPNGKNRTDYYTYDEFNETFIKGKWSYDRHYNRVPTLYGKELPSLITTKCPNDGDLITRRYISYPYDMEEAKARNERFKDHVNVTDVEALETITSSLESLRANGFTDQEILNYINDPSNKGLFKGSDDIADIMSLLLDSGSYHNKPTVANKKAHSKRIRNKKKRRK